MSLTRLQTVANFDTELYIFTRDREKFENNIYLDSKGIATIGVGYALNKSHDIVFSDFAKAGISLSETQKSELSNLLPNKEQNYGKIAPNALKTYNANLLPSALTKRRLKTFLMPLKVGI